MMKINYKDIEAQFNAWFAENAKHNQQCNVSNFHDDLLDAIENGDEQYELRGVYTNTGNAKIFYPNLKIGV